MENKTLKNLQIIGALVSIVVSVITLKNLK